MSPEAISAVISGGGFLASLFGSAFIAGYRWGSVKIRLDILEARIAAVATVEQLAAVKEDLAEIKGMFRLAWRDGPSSPV